MTVNKPDDHPPGRAIDLELKDRLSTPDTEERVKETREKLLPNTVVERYSIELG